MFYPSDFPLNQLPQTTLQRVNAALVAMREGRPVLLSDDADREDEADLILAAEKLTLSSMAMLIRECSGIVCLCLTDAAVQKLDLPPMTANNQSRYATPFTVSIEAREGVSTGVSAADRLTTIRAAIDEDSPANALVSPGHVFPLRAHDKGLLGRQGHTEGAIELAKLAGLKPAAVLCELMNPDGTMARGEQIMQFADRHQLPMLSIAELVQVAKTLAGSSA